MTALGALGVLAGATVSALALPDPTSADATAASSSAPGPSGPAGDPAPRADDDAPRVTDAAATRSTASPDPRTTAPHATALGTAHRTRATGVHGSSAGATGRSGTRAGTAPAAGADGGRTLWSADVARSGLAHFKSTPWNGEGAATPRATPQGLSVSMPAGGKRSEAEPDFPALREGDDYYVGFTVRLGDDFPVDSSNWQVITQFKNEGTGTPPLEVKVARGRFLVDGHGGGFSRDIGAARAGQTTHIVLHVRFSSAHGSVSAWQDGTPTLQGYSPPSGTLLAGTASYLKLGLYRDTAIRRPGQLTFTSYAIGTSQGSVAPGASAAGRGASTAPRAGNSASTAHGGRT